MTTAKLSRIKANGPARSTWTCSAGTRSTATKRTSASSRVNPMKPVLIRAARCSAERDSNGATTAERTGMAGKAIRQNATQSFTTDMSSLKGKANASRCGPAPLDCTGRPFFLNRGEPYPSIASAVPS